VGGAALARTLCLAIALLAFPAAAQTADTFDRYVEQAMAAWETPGLSIAVVKDGAVVMAKGYGVRTQGGADRVDGATAFAAGSISKTFASASVAALIARDRMRWDDRVIDHLPGFRLFDPYVTREMRIRDLLCHRSGLPNGEFLWYYSAFDRREILRRLQHMEPETGFRSAFGYQNLMFVAAGEAVAAAAGMSWDSFVAEVFFRPLGMTSTSTSIDALGGNAATPHARVDGKVQPIPWLNVDNIAPAGGVNTSAADLAKWMRFQLADGASGGEAVLRPEDVDEMRTPQTIIPMSTSRRAARPETLFRAYGLGWYLEDYRGVRLAYHSGRIDGMSSRLTLVPEKNLGVAVLTNRGRSSLPDALTYRLLDAYLGAPARDWSADLLRAAVNHEEARDGERKKTLAQRVADTRPSLPLARYAGLYESPLYGPLDVAFDGTALTLTRNADAIATLSHFHYDTFLANFRSPALRDRLVTFALDKLGQVDALEVEYEGRFAAAAPPLPNDLARAPSDEPSANGKLLGVWSGRWNGIQPMTLAVERIADGSASVVYAWGRAPSWGIAQGGWERQDAPLEKDTLTVTLPEGESATFTLGSDGSIQGLMRDGGLKRRATLRRVP
jgi:CubicO group peptidase (beta-lactamase class C family)